MNYSEVCFLKAEAALRGWQGAGDAKTNYENGIHASFEEMRANAPKDSYSKSNDDKYISEGNVAWNNADSFEAKLEKSSPKMDRNLSQFGRSVGRIPPHRLSEAEPGEAKP